MSDLDLLGKKDEVSPWNVLITLILLLVPLGMVFVLPHFLLRDIEVNIGYNNNIKEIFGAISFLGVLIGLFFSVRMLSKSKTIGIFFILLGIIMLGLSLLISYPSNMVSLYNSLQSPQKSLLAGFWRR